MRRVPPEGFRMIETGVDGYAAITKIGEDHFTVIASWGGGWDHVSVSNHKRVPTWTEMEHVKRACFFEGEVAYQIHVPEDEHINCHPFCLHIWRPQTGTVPRPPTWMVGPMK